MQSHTLHGEENTEDTTYRPPTHGPSKLLWYMTHREWELFLEGHIDLVTIEERIESENREQYQLTGFNGGADRE